MISTHQLSRYFPPLFFLPIVIIVTTLPALHNAHIYVTFLALYGERSAGEGAEPWINQSKVIQSFNHLPPRWTNTQTHPWTCPGALITSSCQSGCWYIVQVLCSRSDTVTSRNKSLMCPNVSGVHRFCVFWIYRGRISIRHKMCHSSPLASETHLYGVWVWSVCQPPIRCLVGSLRGDSASRHFLHLCFFSPDFRQISYYELIFPLLFFFFFFFSLPANKLRSVPKSCYVKKK